MELDQRQAPAPSNIESDPIIGGLRSNQNDKINQLFAHDTQLAQTTFQPQAAPAAPGETVAQPEQRIIDPMIGLRAASTQQRNTAAELGDILTQIAQRKDELDQKWDKEYKSYISGIDKSKAVTIILRPGRRLISLRGLKARRAFKDLSSDTPPNDKTENNTTKKSNTFHPSLK